MLSAVGHGDAYGSEGGPSAEEMAALTEMEADAYRQGIQGWACDPSSDAFDKHASRSRRVSSVGQISIAPSSEIVRLLLFPSVFFQHPQPRQAANANAERLEHHRQNGDRRRYHAVPGDRWLAE
ncbi:hypothetical protein HK405_002674 [Cladochytrium tenue]|nr:hypothetical protein HK405_002674 [Cladochytrium tenue]